MVRLANRYRLALLLGGLLCAQMIRAEGDVRISNAWISEAPPGIKLMGGYLDINNDTTSAVVLTGVTSPCFETIEFHLTEIKNGISSMRRQESITIPAGSAFSFSPGQYHLMLINNTRTLTAGDKVPMTLNFAQGESLQFEADVKRDAPMVQHHH